MEWKNQLYFGDNLDILQDHVGDESIDLIYLDPPFNSQATYNVLYSERNGTQSAAQIEAFEDTWHWGLEARTVYEDVVAKGPEKVSDLLQAFYKFLGGNDMMAYLTMMAPRLVELHRVLKSTGSIYLHCDSTASHFLKLLLDSIFDAKNFANEIIWRRTSSNKGVKRFGPIHQTIFLYRKTENAYFREQKGPYTKEYVKTFFKEEDKRGRYHADNLTGPGIRTGDSGKQWRGYNPSSVGRHWQPASYLYEKYYALTGEDLAEHPFLERLDKLDEAGLIHWGARASVPRYKSYLADHDGATMQDIWAYQPGTRGCVYRHDKIGIDEDVKWLGRDDAERMSYPTQKPEGVLERIIKASSQEGAIVLDPFCGCGTTIAVAERLNRRWIGIDITHIAIALMRHRLYESFGDDLVPYEVHGDPKDLASAQALAEEDRHEFQVWAVGMVGARPTKGGKKGADEGVDGYFYFFDEPYEKKARKPRKILVQAKSGKVGVSHVRDFRGTMERDEANIGAFITLGNPTGPMIQEALKMGFYVPKYMPDQKYQRLQIITVNELFDGKRIEYPPQAYDAGTFAKGERRRKGSELENIELDL